MPLPTMLLSTLWYQVVSWFRLRAKVKAKNATYDGTFEKVQQLRTETSAITHEIEYVSQQIARCGEAMTAVRQNEQLLEEGLEGFFQACDKDGSGVVEKNPWRYADDDEFGIASILCMRDDIRKKRELLEERQYRLQIHLRYMETELQAAKDTLEDLEASMRELSPHGVMADGPGSVQFPPPYVAIEFVDANNNDMEVAIEAGKCEC
ncbi:hypothetical protein TRVL_04202 [Trypanosoma vivax]|nr:hypothetical protein TRVL_04202 [Trypanosoma vivax]